MPKKIVMSIHYGHNATVGLSINGKVECLLSEERLVRLKNALGFPFATFDFIKKQYLNNDINNIDYLVVNDETGLAFQHLKNCGFQPQKYTDYYYKTRKNDIKKICRSTLKRKFLNVLKFSKVSSFFVNKKNISQLSLVEEISKITGINKEKILLNNHHKAHALSCLYFLDPNPEYLIFTLDGEGDNICASVNKWYNNDLIILSTCDRNFSLGYLYSQVTGYLGMKPDEHEFKVMGMAPYAFYEEVDRLKQIFHHILCIDNEGNFCSKISMRDLSEYLIQNLLYERFDIICGAIQKFTEEIIVEWIRFWINKTNIKSICVSGGVFMNVKAAKVVSELDEVNSIFVVPSSGDESLVIGGLFYGNKMLGLNYTIPITDLYLGRQFSDIEIEKFLTDNKINLRYKIEKLNEDQMAKKVAFLLANNEIVSRCCGREEWGARSLGNRSILCNPSNFKNINILNNKIKSRDFWMPFTPTILVESAVEYVTNPKNIIAPYMCITFDTTQKAKDELSAAIHPQDYTIRPQILEYSWNKEYYKIIFEFKKITGIPSILNTSFNLHGEPNVGDPEDAIYTVDNSGLKYLVLGNYLLEKING